MSWWSALNGATKARARSSIGCPNAPMWWRDFRAAIMPGIRWSLTARSTNCTRCPLAWCAGGKLSVIGNGVVLDPWHLVKEIETIRAQGVEITPETLMIAENTPLILPFHGELDRARENQNSVAKIGTTGRGIGPAYEDKVGRRVIRVADLADDATLELRVDRALVHHDALRRGLGLDPIDRDALIASLRAIAPQILPFRGPRVGRCCKTNARPASASCSKRGAGARFSLLLLDVDFWNLPVCHPRLM